MNIKAVSFDLTGTLFSPSPSLGDICVETLTELGIKNIPESIFFNSRTNEARKVALKNKIEPISEEASIKYWDTLLWEIFAGYCPNAYFKKATKIIYKKLSNPSRWKLMPGVLPILSLLNFLEIPIFILSNGDSRWKKLLEESGLDKFFKKIFISAETGVAKPNPKAFENICLFEKIKKGELLHIGDSLNADILAAQKFGANAILINAKIIVPPENIIFFRSLSELPDFFKNLNREKTNLKKSKDVRDALNQLRGIPEDDAPENYNIPEANAIRCIKKNAQQTARFLEKHPEVPLLPGDIFDLKTIIAPVVQSKGFFKGSAQNTIFENWEQIIPTSFQNKCHFQTLTDNYTHLIIACNDSIARFELTNQKRNILKKISTIPNCKKITKISFVEG